MTGYAVINAVFIERRRQIERCGYTHEHDDKQTEGEIAQAAACYALPPAARHELVRWAVKLWPWDSRPSYGDRRTELVRAAAMLLAEIERIDRAAAKGPD